MSSTSERRLETSAAPTMEDRAAVPVKVCCIGSVEEAQLAIACGAAALGLVSRMPSGPGVIPEALISEIAVRVPPDIATFLLTSESSADAIVAQQRRCAVSTLQLCDRVPDGVHGTLRKALPEVDLVQVIHVKGPESIDEALRVAPEVDMLLLDSGSQDLPVRELGGTGRIHDWEISRRIVERSPVPVFLAGGLTPENVAVAIRAVRPFGVDVCTGVRSGPRLDATMLTRFVEEVAVTSHAS